MLFARLFNNLISDNAPITDKQFLELEIMRWKFSPLRKMQLDGERYYRGDHDILKRKRTAIDEKGELMDVDNVPNNRLVDNQYQKMVDQKVNYLLSKPLTFESGNKSYDEILKTIFNAQFLNKLKNGGTDALNGGLFWLYPYFDDEGKLAFKRFKSYEILPFWKDSEHTILDCAIRLYEVEGYEGTTPKIFEKIEIFTHDKILRYDLENGRLIEDIENPYSYYAYMGEQGLTWDKIPLVAFKYNNREIPLIKRVKGLQDGLNIMMSTLTNSMEENNLDNILIIKNYDGQNLGEFRKNLATYRAVKVRTIDGAEGGIDSLQIEVNAANYELVLKTLKKAIIENAMGYDAKDDRLGGNANMLNIKSMYSDIDLDADNMESEFKASFDQLLYFVNAYLASSKQGTYNEPVKITFNRDMLINETEIIDNLVKLGVQLPQELLIGQVPFVDDVQAVLEMVKKEKAENDIYANAFANQSNNPQGVNDGE